MARFLEEDDIERLLAGSGDDQSDEDDQQDVPIPGIVDESQSETDSSSDDDVPLSNLKWTKKKFRGPPLPQPSVSPQLNPVSTPAQYFECYFTPELMEHLLSQPINTISQRLGLQ